MAFALNLGWEVAQMPLYDVDFRFARCLRAAVGDAALIFTAGAAASLLAWRYPWAFWSAMVVMLLAVAVTIEATALATGRWEYGGAMPTILGLGRSPLVQLPLLGSVAARATLPR